MKKYIDNGKVAVLYSPGFGAGWSTWNFGREFNGQNLGEVLLFDPVIVQMVLAGHNARIERYCEKFYGDTGYFGGADNLQVVWIEPGIEFRVNEYDGSEDICYKENANWIVA